MRTTEEWQGRDDDHVPPPSIRLRVFDRCKGRCHSCTRKISAGERWTLEHIVALCNGGANAESNLGLTCSNCLPAKNAADMTERTVTRTKRKAYLGIKRKSRPMAGSRLSKWKRKMSGEIIAR